MLCTKTMAVRSAAASRRIRPCPLQLHDPGIGDAGPKENLAYKTKGKHGIFSGQYLAPGYY